MARIYPFRALRYDSARVNMEDVVTQPYDKITPQMQQRYYEASPYNLVRVILGRQFSTDTDVENATPAPQTTSAPGVPAASSPKSPSQPSTATPRPTPSPGSSEVRERRGFIALGHLYDYAEKVVYRHEQTFPQPKSERLSLFKTTRAYCEQIYMLYSDPAFTAEKLIFGIGTRQSPADLVITDEYDVIHKVWKLTDPILINLIVTAMADKKLIIADGHHRYETSVAYARERAIQLRLPLNRPRDEDERLSPGHLPVPAFPEAAMMMTFVNMDAPGITILPTHRVVHGLEDFNSSDFIARAGAFYTITELPTPDIPSAANNAFIAVTHERSYLMLPKPEAIAPLLENLPLRQRQLGLAQLHAVVLDHLLGLDPATVTNFGNIQYLREAGEAAALVTSGQANIAFLVHPVTLDQLRDVSFSGEVMPQKSTDFYPKLLSGLAIYALD